MWGRRRPSFIYIWKFLKKKNLQLSFKFCFQFKGQIKARNQHEKESSCSEEKAGSRGEGEERTLGVSTRGQRGPL